MKKCNKCKIEKDLKEFSKYSFKDGAKWQDKRMYSEEDLISFAHFYFAEEFNSTMQTSKSTKDIFTEWLKQFKNK
jgi:cytochrome c553